MGKRIRISVCYYLNAAEDNWYQEWDEDLAAMKELGCDGIDGATPLVESEALAQDMLARWGELMEKYDFLEWRGGVGGREIRGSWYDPQTGDAPEQYTMTDVWGDTVKGPEDVPGQKEPTFRPAPNIWSAEFRRDVQFPDMEKAIRRLMKCRRYSGGGYTELFQFSEPVSYGRSDAARFREFIRHKYGELHRLSEAWGRTLGSWNDVEPPRVLTLWTREWQDWVEARHFWTAQWARETVAFAKSVKPDIKVWLCDCMWNQSPWGVSNRDMAAVYTDQIAQPFDCFLVEDHFYAEKMTREKIFKCIENDIGVFRRLCGDKHLAWSGQVMRYGDFKDIDIGDALSWIEKALECGVDEICYYNYRSARKTGGSFDHKKSLCHNRPLARALAALHKRIR